WAFMPVRGRERSKALSLPVRPIEEGQSVDPRVVGELRVKSGPDDGPVAHRDRLAVERREHHTVARFVDARRANEHRRKRFVEILDVEIGLEAVALAAEG